MTEFAGKSVMTIDNLTIDDNTAADTCAEGNHDEVLHTARSSVGHLTHCSSIGIICKSYRNTVHLLFQEVGNRNCSLVAPFEIDSILDFSGIVVSVRNTHSDTAHLTGNACIRNHFVDSFSEFVDIRIDLVISIGTDNCLGQNLAAHIYNTYLGSLSADIHTHYIRHIHLVHNQLN